MTPIQRSTPEGLRRRRESKSEEYGSHNPDWLQRADMSLKFSVPSLAYPQFSQ
jgi:hypothetical protein